MQTMMAWSEILPMIFGGAAGGGIIAGIIKLYTAKSTKNTIDVDNFKKIFDEAQELYTTEFKRMKEEREEAKKSSEEYRKTTDEKIDRMLKEMQSMQKTNNIKLRAINSAYRCGLPVKIEDCPVLKTLNEQGEVCENKKDV